MDLCAMQPVYALMAAPPWRGRACAAWARCGARARVARGRVWREGAVLLRPVVAHAVELGALGVVNVEVLLLRDSEHARVAQKRQVAYRLLHLTKHNATDAESLRREKCAARWHAAEPTVVVAAGRGGSCHDAAVEWEHSRVLFGPRLNQLRLLWSSMIPKNPPHGSPFRAGFIC
eukprot:6173200-Pleurochrysis_carterae.AAC.2